MSPRKQQDPLASPARQDFARRLRELRVPRGFRTARSLARKLEIDENRYTRYERGEVEPDLAMIRRICETLAVTPNDLLGGVAGPAVANGSAPRAKDRFHSVRAAPPPEPPPAGSLHGIATASWLVAEAVMELRRAHAQQSTAPDAKLPPLAVMSQTGALFKAIMDRPFEAITELLSDPDISGAQSPQAVVLTKRIDHLVDMLRSPPSFG